MVNRRSVRVNRHRPSGNAEVWLTNWWTDQPTYQLTGVGARDANASKNNVFWKAFAFNFLALHHSVALLWYLTQYYPSKRPLPLSPSSACVRWMTEIVRCAWVERGEGGGGGGGSCDGDMFLLRQLRPIHFGPPSLVWWRPKAATVHLYFWQIVVEFSRMKPKITFQSKL